MKTVTTRALAIIALGSIAGAAVNATGVSAAPRGLVAPLQNASGAPLGTVRFTPTDDGKIAIKVLATGLTPGFHGFHIHSVGTCDPNAEDAAGNPSPFFTAGGHYNPVTTNTHGAHAGDMSPLLIMGDGSGSLRLKTDRFKLADLMDSDGSAVILHAGPDNLAHVPGTTTTGGERYHSHVDDVLGADTATKATGDAGARFGCGVVEKATR